MAFAFSCLNAVLDKSKKPFNPLLGETFEFQKGKLKYLAE
jgi:hypothetical protein